MFIRLSSPALILVVVLLVFGAAGVGAAIGRWMRSRPGLDMEAVGVVQGTLLGLVGLLLAFGLSMAVGRYENRRALVVQEANDLGTTYLRAQLLSEPTRTASLALLRHYADEVTDMATLVPGSRQFDRTLAQIDSTQNDLWATAGSAVKDDSVGTAPRLYVESLNDTIDRHTDRVASLGNHVPDPVLVLEVFGSMIAIAALSVYLALIGRGVAIAMVAAALVSTILLVSFDLDRPARGLIKVPATSLVEVRESMKNPPAYGTP